MRAEPNEAPITRMVEAAARTSPSEVVGLLDLLCELVGAHAVRFHVADYSLRQLQRVGAGGGVGPPTQIAGTLMGRVFTSGETHVAGAGPMVLTVPVRDGACPIGVLELDVDAWDERSGELLAMLVPIFVMAWIVKARYTDHGDRARRSEPLTLAAEVQWELLPPLTCASDEVALSGILEPAYDIGGDSFDYAFDVDRVDLAIVDAIGHGISAVSMAAAAVNSLRNSRRARAGLVDTYERADRAIATHFGDAYYVTGLVGFLDLPTGTFTWINAGHVVPMLVRNGTAAGRLECRPSMPFGLGGPVVEVAECTLQRGDRVLFYTDGITEARARDGSFFGDDRLADLLVRASLEDLPVQETVQRLADSIVAFSDVGLRDDATMLLLEYQPDADRRRS